MKNSLRLHETIRRALVDLDLPVATEYDIFVLGLRIVREGGWRGEEVRPRPRVWDRARNRKLIQTLERKRALTPDSDFVSGAWRAVEVPGAGSAEEVCCLVDPFCYISYLSAMQHYGLTDRSPVHLQLTTPARPVWNAMRDARIVRDLGEGAAHLQTASLRRIGFREEVRRRPVRVHETRHPAVAIELREQRARITSVGRTFVDMLDMPALCGGIRHVLEVWGQEAASWQEEIIQAVDAGSTKIVKMRAGHLLEERLGARDARIDAWKAEAQRGSSRKLDPDAPYAPVYSETWMISLNV